MTKFLAIILSVALCSCSVFEPRPDENPVPFVLGEKAEPLPGCKDLRNRNPKADC